jgi:hypothetical protein
MAKKLAMVFGIVFILVSVLGFIPNGIVGDMGFFHTNLAHDIVHLIVGLALVIVAVKAADKACCALKVFGVVYLLLAIIGFVVVSGSSVNSLLGVHVNGADNWLHLVLGIVLVASACALGCKKGGHQGDTAPVVPPAAPMQ